MQKERGTPPRPSPAELAKNATERAREYNQKHFNNARHTKSIGKRKR